MKWFLVRYVYRIVFEQETYQCQFDEQQRIIRSDSLTNAFEKAKYLADSFNPCFKNYLGENISWKFVCIAGLVEIFPPSDGSEISSVVVETADAVRYIKEMEMHKRFLEEKIRRNST
ncbi:DUF4288 domain-containing protein [Pedobacter sp. Leaf176]|uniref:DUF4288 domain-containing protein n=1 Tax=Pedobacter sp. Leaf176 TaxID=1736286 RepID=UPI000701A8C6|nr:DUF4288 domain-containing protein [Pedobacter sp. Leaf176]KQR66871.1 hypothetical protein ASF92_19150 [Pedobacter sp. Leaf176]